MNRHGFDPVSFLLGILVTGLGVMFLTGVTDVDWLAPVVLVGVGAAFIVGAVTRSS